VGREVREVAQALFDSYRIDCRPMTTFDLNGLRISLSIFNTEDQIDMLMAALRELAEPAAA
jgi:selenocysteine lyase/cysteine desulfurase